MRGWSHYPHWYCDPSWPGPGPIDRHVSPIAQEDPQLWEQWLAWPGPFCSPRFCEHFEVHDAFGYVLDGRLVSAAQLLAGTSDFAWEFGVETLDGFVRRGFATEAARAATQRILTLGLSYRRSRKTDS